jgi:hypothetical protein
MLELTQTFSLGSLFAINSQRQSETDGLLLPQLRVVREENKREEKEREKERKKLSQLMMMILIFSEMMMVMMVLVPLPLRLLPRLLREKRRR